MEPLMLSNQSALEQLFEVMLMTPWAFVGFESVSHATEEFAFDRKRSFRILAIVVATTFLLYALLILISVSAYPSRYTNWYDYLVNIGNLKGIDGLPPFFAARSYLGMPGVNLLMVALLALVLSSLV